MSARGSCPHDLRARPKSRVPPTRKTRAAGQGASRPSRPRLRGRALALALIGMLALIALPPVLVTPSGEVELIATGALTLFACVLVAIICYEIRRR
jgi:hypothetical protein